MIRIFALGLLALLTFGQPVAAQTGITAHENLPYVAGSTNALQQLNLFIPAGDLERDERRPLLIWIGGGAWSYVDRHMETDVSRRIAAQGIAVAAVGHRLSPATWQNPDQTEGVEHPAHIEDIAAALKWLWDKADTYKIDRNRIYVGGFSSGAHLAALLVSDLSFIEKHGLSADAIKGVIAIGGSYDIPDYHRAFAQGSRPELAHLHVEAVFGANAERQRAASPALYAETITTPMLLMSDRRTYYYTRIFEEALVDAGKENLEVIHVRNLDHGPLWRNLSRAENSAYRDRVVSFVRNGLAGTQTDTSAPENGG